MHYYRHHIGDFIRDTSNLTDHQLATYLRMIWCYYDTETPLSGSIEDIAFAMRSDEKTVRLLLKHYFNEDASGWVHVRCEREIAEYRGKRESARNSANARWSNANAMRTQCERNANVQLSTANQEPITNNQEVKEDTRRRAPRSTPPPCPEEVDSQVWSDWLALREAKRAPVTSTVIDFVRQEAEKAGLSFDAFLRVWCARGSQALQADWLKPHERGQPQPMPMTRQQGVEARNRATVERYLARMEAEGDEQQSTDD